MSRDNYVCFRSAKGVVEYASWSVKGNLSIVKDIDKAQRFPTSAAAYAGCRFIKELQDFKVRRVHQ